VKTISVSHCGECPFVNHDFESRVIAEQQCNAYPSAVQHWDCSDKAVPAECPLRVEVIVVQVKP
jgi:hypothetical protein